MSALAKLKPTLVLEDATVLISKIPEMIEMLTVISKKNDIFIGTFGHAGDCNLHPTILTDRRDEKEWKKVEKIIETIFYKALELCGNLSGNMGSVLQSPDFLKKRSDVPLWNIQEK